MSRINAEEARELLHCDPETGVLTWIGRASKRTILGSEAGGICTTGYRIVHIRGNNYFAHRLVWLIVYGDWPPFGIDHINGERVDNRIVNLRSVPQSINVQNVRRARKDNLIGLAGVTQRKSKFRAWVYHHNRRLYIGTYPTAELAHAAYVARKREIHPGCSI